jgi:energy-coupling factor transporter ATP-binding protein EcfA2
MLSFNPQSDDAIIVGSFKAYHAKQTKLVFYDKNCESEAEYSDSELKEMLSIQYGKTAVRTKKALKELELDDEKFAMIKKPNVKGEFYPFYPENLCGERNVYYIFGKSGSGKSTLAKYLSKLYSSVVKVYIVSPVHDNEYHGQFVDINKLVVVDDENDEKKMKQDYEKAKIKFKYMKKNGELDDPDDQMEYELLLASLKPEKRKTNLFKLTNEYKKMIEKPSFWIFDDTEVEADQAKLEFLQNSQLLTGRHDNITVATLNHQANNGAKTRNLINESNVFCFFSPFNRYTQYFCVQYLQMDAKQIGIAKKLLKNSRYVVIYKDLNLILSQDTIMTF